MSEVSGKIHSVAELEARMRQQQQPQTPQGVKMHHSSGNVNMLKKSEEEMAAFRKLVN